MTIRTKWLNLNLLPHFVTLVSESSVTKAAEKMGVTQSAMSQILKQLRYQMSDPILVRHARGVIPTEKAQELAKKISVYVDEIHRVVAEYELEADLDVNFEFVLRMSNQVENILLPRMLPILHKTKPSIRIQINDLPKHSIDAEDLSECDITIVSTTTDDLEIDNSGLSQNVMSEQLVGVINTNRSLETTKDLKKFEWVIPNNDPFLCSEIKHMLHEEAGIAEPKFDIHVLNPFQLVSQTEQFAFITTDRFYSEASRPNLKKVPLPLSKTDVNVKMFWHSKNDGSPLHKWFRKLLVDELSEPIRSNDVFSVIDDVKAVSESR